MTETTIQRVAPGPDDASGPSRRRVLVTGGVVVAAVAVTAACGSSTDSASSPTTAAASEGGSPSPSAEATVGGMSDVAIATADVPVGGGMILADQKVVVTQPVAGTFVAFSAVCTHKGCAVGSVADGTINCPCHGSKFSIEDGSVKAGPATAPLPAVELTVSGDSISLA